MGRPRTEEELVALARGGDADAYSDLVRSHQQIAFRTAMLITRNAADAEDAAQEAFVKAWRALPRFREGQPLRPWLLTIVANEARNRRRSAGRPRGAVAARRRRGASDRRRRPPRPRRRSSPARSREDLLAGLARAARRRPARARLPLPARAREADTAAALGVRPGTVKSRTSRALARLREALDA